MKGSNLPVVNSNSRRRITSIMATAGIVVPAFWSMPRVDSVLLPAHAVTSLQCGPQSATTTDSETDLDMVIVTFNPSAGCDTEAVLSANQGLDLSRFDGDIIIGIDVGSGPPVNWDTEILGDDNWSVTPDPGENNDRSTTVELFATRLNAPNAGAVYRVILEIEISGDPGVTGTVVVSAHVVPA